MTDLRVDEETPLLFSADDHEESDKVITPLPKLQIGILLLVQVAEPICSQCIYPFINQVPHHSEHAPTHPNVFLAHQRAGYHRRRREKGGVLCR